MADRSSQQPHRYGERGQRVARTTEGVQGQENRGCTPQGGQANPKPVQSETAVIRPQNNKGAK